MKNKLLLISFSLFVSIAYSQTPSLQIFNGSTDITNTTINLSKDTSNFEIVFNPTVKNISGNTIDVYSSRKQVSVLSGTSNYFCWGSTCYSPSANASSSGVSMASNATNNTFIAHYEINLQVGTSTVRYKFYDFNNPNDSAVVTVNYTSTVGIDDAEIAKNYLSQAYPNPAKNFVSFNINNSVLIGDDATFIVYDILGKKVNEITISKNQNKIVIATDNFKEGIYFGCLISNNQKKTMRKFVVSH